MTALIFKHNRFRIDYNAKIFICIYILMLIITSLYSKNIFYAALFVAGLFVFIYFYLNPISVVAIEKFIIIAVVLQVVDLCHFVIWGSSIEFLPASLFGDKHNDVGFFRPIGIFYEANAYATTLLYLSILLYIKTQRRYLNLASFSMIGSLSLFGIVSGFYQLWVISNFKRKLFVLIGGVILITLLIYINFVFIDIFVYRITNFWSDPSFQARLGLGKWQFGILPMSPDPAVTGKLIAGNQLGYYLGSLGVVFLLILIAYFVILNYFKVRLSIIGYLFLLCVSYQTTTYMFSYALLGTYFGLRNDKR